jgi:rubrerythrin
MIHAIVAVMRGGYICRACGTEVMYPEKYNKCPVCGIKWG